MPTEIWVPAILMVVGIVGIVVPVLPGFLLVLAGVFVWAFDTGTTTSWVVFGVCAVIWLAGVLLQYLLPGRRMKRDGVGTGTLLLAAALGIAGMFVIPVVGFIVGFVGGIYLVEYGRSRTPAQAWARTRSALKAVLHSMGIELLAAVLIVVVWVVTVAVTGIGWG